MLIVLGFSDVFILPADMFSVFKTPLHCITLFYQQLLIEKCVIRESGKPLEKNPASIIYSKTISGK